MSSSLIFSRRYYYALQNKKLSINLSSIVRKKLLFYLNFYNDITWHTDDTGYNYSSSILEDVQKIIKFELGLEEIESVSTVINDGNSEKIFDILELTYKEIYYSEKQYQFKSKINEVFELNEHPWRLSNGEIFKLDNDFLGARLASKANDLLSENNFSGPLEEYEKARRELAGNEVKGSIGDAGQSLESIMSTITGLKDTIVSKLINELDKQGYFDDLPEKLRGGFKKQVLETVPFMRNNFCASHGQGPNIIDIPKEYGELCLNLTASFHCFLISKYLSKKEPEDNKSNSIDEDEIPF